MSRNLPIVTKFLLVIGCFGLFSLAVATFSTYEMRAIDERNDELFGHEGKAETLMARASQLAQQSRAAIADLLMATDVVANEKALNELTATKAELAKTFDQASALAPARAAEFGALKSRVFKILEDNCGESIKLGASAVKDAEVLASHQAYLKTCSPNFPKMAADFRKVSDDLSTYVETLNNEIAAWITSAIYLTLGLIVGGLVLVSVGGFLFIRASIVNPIRQLGADMTRLANADFGVEVDTARRDEIGAMAKCVQVFKEAGLEKIRLTEEAEALRRRTAEDAAHQEAIRAQAAREQAEAIESLGKALASLSDGDLTYRMDARMAADYKKIQDDFNAAAETLHATMARIAANSGVIRSGSAEITSASDDLSRRTEQQAASLEETSAALEQMSEAVRRSAQNAANAKKLTDMAKGGAITGGDVVRQAIQAMAKIEGSSGEIGQIIGVIDEIAFQTNLLALNAGVEAARAGEAGRGFAVVASEVRALAQRSAEAAKQIKVLIESAKHEVQDGVRLVNVTGEALQAIVDQVITINKAVEEIAASADEQSNGLREITTAISDMDRSTQQNAAMVEESTAASHNLAQEATVLADLVRQFTLDELRAITRHRAAA